MTNKFQVTVKANTIFIKIVKLILIVDIGYALLAFGKDFSNSYVYLTFLLGLFCAILLLYLKSYKIIGNINIESDTIAINSSNLKIDLPINTINRIGFKLQGSKRLSYIPTLFQPIGVNLPNGTGNLIEIETQDNLYKFDILLLTNQDTKALEVHISKFKNLGLKVNIVKLPGILGDTI